MQLQNKVVIVTGGGSGFGEGMARRFDEEGATVVIADIDKKNGERVAAEMSSPFFVETDVSSNESVAALVSKTVAEFGCLDVLINNAGMPQRRGPMTDVDEATFDRIFAVNVKSIFLTCKHAVPELQKARSGVILNTASTAAKSPRPGLTWYNGSKGAVLTLTKSMALELAPKNIRVNAINPVIGETGMTREFLGGEDTPALRKKFIETIPLGRMSTPIDIANAALFLCSEEASLITGVCLEVDGGRCV
ncbi:MAG: 4-formylbenzenesulfonate dehydrogenase TsaC1/TsaC2 [Alphaproteobacteria bacterium MarineAlpha3_Bin5]|nr:3-oxoacyl-ACP reductase [Magnetovibrio sp.]PPR79369.1 MAG: 4-formylbenzenesulfonate dehydrogenase TsaC1/TsaC2 [Alphaproteobacteria bacterium MarineAlpha3_Bin5]